MIEDDPLWFTMIQVPVRNTISSAAGILCRSMSVFYVLKLNTRRNVARNEHAKKSPKGPAACLQTTVDASSPPLFWVLRFWCDTSMLCHWIKPRRIPQGGTTQSDIRLDTERLWWAVHVLIRACITCKYSEYNKSSKKRMQSYTNTFHRLRKTTLET